jgi:polysaccharide chain length determinant protein (PEP-CTERM system associated)
VTSILTSLPRSAVRAIVGVWRRRWLAAAVAWGVAVAGWLAVMAIPDVYESRAQVYINTDTAIEQAISEVGSGANLDKSVRVIRQQILSRDNLERVIYDAGLDADIYGPVDLERRVKGLADAIEIRSEEDQYFTITYGDTDPVVAQRVVSSLLDLFIEQNLGATISDVDGALGFLDAEIAEKRAALEEVDAAIAAFRRENASELAGTERVARRLEAKEAELARARDQIARYELQRSTLRRELSATPRTNSGGELERLRLQLAQLRSQFNENYPDIRQIEARIAELEGGVAGLPDNADYVRLERSMASVNDEVAALQGQERRVRAEIEELELSAAQTPEVEASLQALMREKAQAEEVYDQLTDERAQAAFRGDITAMGGGIGYTKYEVPRVAAEPSWPPRGLMTIGVCLMALGAGAGLAFVLSLLDRTYTQVADIEESLGLPVLGAVSPSPTRASRTRGFGDRMALGAVLATLLMLTAGLFYVQELRAPPGEIETAALSGRAMSGGALR